MRMPDWTGRVAWVWLPGHTNLPSRQTRWTPNPSESDADEAPLQQSRSRPLGHACIERCSSPNADARLDRSRGMGMAARPYQPTKSANPMESTRASRSAALSRVRNEHSRSYSGVADTTNPSPRPTAPHTNLVSWSWRGDSTSPLGGLSAPAGVVH